MRVPSTIPTIFGFHNLVSHAVDGSQPKNQWSLTALD
jgi:hypothetical protein